MREKLTIRIYQINKDLSGEIFYLYIEGFHKNLKNLKNKFLSIKFQIYFAKKILFLST